jgi:flagellin-like hook-associated protein FlgL
VEIVPAAMTRDRLPRSSDFSDFRRARAERAHALASFGACMSALDLFLPLAKVDLDRRLVTGVATAETPDRSGEIFDYASSKPYFEKWSAEAAAASGGKSFGAVRAMHTPIAAGKLTDLAFDDNAKRITVVAKIVDDDEWRKVQEGVYTGFSQGGRYVKRWADPDSGLTRYTADPHEISLVDLPCVPDATFDVVKNGTVEKRSFASRDEAIDTANADVDADNDDWDADKREFSAAQREKDAEEGIAMPDGSYPIRSAKDVEDAARDCCRSGEKPDVKAHIIARAKAIGAETALPDDWTETADKATARSSPRRASHAPDLFAKAAAALTHATLKLDRAAQENASLRKALDNLTPALTDMKKRISALEAQPLPAKAALRFVTKTADGADNALVSADDAVRRLASLPAHERALALTKLSLANPAAPRF